MTKQETLDKNAVSLQKLGNEIFYNKDGVMRSLDEYGKYCAEIAFDDGFNLGFIDCQRPSFEQWWSEFQKEETNCPIKADS